MLVDNSMRVLFLDTNMFLQCRDLAELPWQEITGDEKLLLLVARPVQEEIDRLKQDGNSRRTKRARAANSLFRKILSSQNSKVTIRTALPLVEIAFSPLASIQESGCKLLDLTRADDRIIAEALHYRSENPADNVAILTHDTQPMLTAKHCGLVYIPVPNNWLLPPEPDTRDRRIFELEQKIRQLGKTHPEISVVAKNKDDTTVDHLSLLVECYDGLSSTQLEELVTAAQVKYPIVTEFGNTEIPPRPSPPPGQEAILRLLGAQHQFVHPNEQEITKYLKEDYPKWKEKVEEFFRLLPSRLETPHRCFGLSLVLANTGTTPAENVIVEVKALGGFLLKPPTNKGNKKEDSKKAGCFPSPPSAPKGHWVQVESSYSSILKSLDLMGKANWASPHLPNLNSPPERDRHAFYWKPNRPSSYMETWIFECEEFRHKVDDESFLVNIFVPPGKNLVKGALQCRVTAKNLPLPYLYTLPITISFDKKESIEIARRILHDQKH